MENSSESKDRRRNKMKNPTDKVGVGIEDLSTRPDPVTQGRKVRKKDKPLLIHGFLRDEMRDFEEIHGPGPKHNETRMSHMCPQ
jgi:hypothetical protein